MGIQFFKRFYSWLDFILMIVNILLFVQFTQVLGYGEQLDYNDYKLQSVLIRYTIVIGIVV